MTKNLIHRWLTHNNQNRSHIIFGSNTDVGKTIFTAGLVNASIRKRSKALNPLNYENEGKYGSITDDYRVQYVKPLQCGGSDQSFVDRHLETKNRHPNLKYNSFILHQWESYASPHLASRIENHFVSNSDVLSSLTKTILHRTEAHWSKSESNLNSTEKKEISTTFVETAGGVLSPGPASPHQNQWATQADLYSPLVSCLPVILVGDGTLGGISATLSSLECLWMRGYQVDAIALLEKPIHDDNDYDDNSSDNATTTALSNTEAIQEYIESRSFDSLWKENVLIKNIQIPLNPMDDVFCITKPLPPMPISLTNWFDDLEVLQMFDRIENVLENKWRLRIS